MTHAAQTTPQVADWQLSLELVLGQGLEGRSVREMVALALERIAELQAEDAEVDPEVDCLEAKVLQQLVDKAPTAKGVSCATAGGIAPALRVLH